MARLPLGRYHSCGPSSAHRDSLRMNLVTNLGRAASLLSILRRRNFGLVWSSITLAGMASQMETVVVLLGPDTI